MAFLDEQDGGLITHWKTITGITALVGFGSGAKIWPEVAKQGAIPPYIMFTEEGAEPIINLSGRTGLRRTPLRVYCYGRTKAEAKSLSELVNLNTVNMRGMYYGTDVKRVQVFSIDSGVEYRQDANDAKNFWIGLLISFIHSE